MGWFPTSSPSNSSGLIEPRAHIFHFHTFNYHHHHHPPRAHKHFSSYSAVMLGIPVSSDFDLRWETHEQTSAPGATSLCLLLGEKIKGKKKCVRVCVQKHFIMIQW